MKPLLKLSGALLAILSSGLPGTSAAEDVTRLTLEYSDGTQAHYALSDKPVLTLSGSDLVLKSASAEVAFIRSDLSHFYFTRGTVAGIDEISADDFMVSYSGNVATISGEGVCGAFLYDMGGRCLKSFSAAGGMVVADLNPLSSGVYLLSVPGRPAMKVLVKH